MHLVPDWKRAYRWLSMHCFALITAITGTWVSLPDDMKAVIPPKYVMVLVAIVGVGGIIGRLVQQKGSEAA